MIFKDDKSAFRHIDSLIRNNEFYDNPEDDSRFYDNPASSPQNEIKRQLKINVRKYLLNPPEPSSGLSYEASFARNKKEGKNTLTEAIKIAKDLFVPLSTLVENINEDTIERLDNIFGKEIWKDFTLPALCEVYAEVAEDIKISITTREIMKEIIENLADSVKDDNKLAEFLEGKVCKLSIGEVSVYGIIENGKIKFQDVSTTQDTSPGVIKPFTLIIPVDIAEFRTLISEDLTRYSVVQEIEELNKVANNNPEETNSDYYKDIRKWIAHSPQDPKVSLLEAFAIEGARYYLVNKKIGVEIEKSEEEKKYNIRFPSQTAFREVLYRFLGYTSPQFKFFNVLEKLQKIIKDILSKKAESSKKPIEIARIVEILVLYPSGEDFELIELSKLINRLKTASVNDEIPINYKLGGIDGSKSYN